MRLSILICLRGMVLMAITGACLYAECMPGGLAVVVPKTSPTDSLSMAQLRKLVIGDVHTWPDRSKVTLVSTDQEGTVFKCLLSTVVRMTPPEYHKYLLSAEFRGDEPMHIRTVDSAGNAVRALAGSTGSFSVVDANSLPTLGDSFKVVSINGKRPGEPGYPL